MKICIIGAGTYGSYLLKRLLEEYPTDTDITVIEVGDHKTRSETEIGISSQSEQSKAAKAGRYFGLGGTSARWGGQILFFDKRDNVDNDPTWRKIIKINEEYQTIVFDKLLKNNNLQKHFDANEGSIKTGLWLKYAHRNLFKHIPKAPLKRVNIIQNHRVIDFNIHNGLLTDILCQNREGGTQTIEADRFYLTAGAIESCRLLLELQEQYGIAEGTDLGKNVGDHLSVELFKIKNTEPQLENTSMLPILLQGNLITKRLIIHSKTGRMGYLHPSFNREVKIFSTLKQFLFGKQKLSFSFKDLVEGIVFLIKFGYHVFILRKMYAHKNDWSLQLDIEQACPNENTLMLGEKKDSYGQREIILNWQVSKSDVETIAELQESMTQLLKDNHIVGTPIYNADIATTKIEDVYHPVGFIRLGDDPQAVVNWDCSVKGISNLYHFSTALFPSAKSINPTAAAFCFIEHHLEKCPFSTFHPRISQPISTAA
jgi:hypothetical protein